MVVRAFEVRARKRTLVCNLANDLDPKKYLNYLLEHRPSVEMSDDELKQLAPWSSAVRETCK